eukprot:scaffold17906_cov44-Phaeocystis_antarctica.AAC.2
MGVSLSSLLFLLLVWLSVAALPSGEGVPKRAALGVGHPVVLHHGAPLTSPGAHSLPGPRPERSRSTLLRQVRGVGQRGAERPRLTPCEVPECQKRFRTGFRSVAVQLVVK